MKKDKRNVFVIIHFVIISNFDSILHCVEINSAFKSRIKMCFQDLGVMNICYIHLYTIFF